VQRGRCWGHFGFLRDNIHGADFGEKAEKGWGKPTLELEEGLDEFVKREGP